MFHLRDIGFTLLYFKMAVMSHVPETKMADVDKLISLRNLLVRKVPWLVLTIMSATLILSRAFGADCMTMIAYIYSRLPRTHSFHCNFQRNTLSPFRLTETTHTHSFSYILTSSSQPHENVYILQPYETISRLEHNLRNFDKPRKIQTINMGEDTFLLTHVAIFLYIDTLHEILCPHTFYSLQDTFNIYSFSLISVLVHTHAQEYSTDSC